MGSLACVRRVGHPETTEASNTVEVTTPEKLLGSALTLPLPLPLLLLLPLPLPASWSPRRDLLKVPAM